jgi:hypothetical protein
MRTPTALILAAALAAATLSPASALPAYPKAGCNSLPDPAGDAWLGNVPGGQSEPTLDITGVVFGTTRTHLNVFIRVKDLQAKPSYAPGYFWEAKFYSNGKEVTAAITDYDPDDLAKPYDATVEAGVMPPRKLLYVDDNRVVHTAMAVTFDLQRDMVTFEIPLAELKPLGRLGPVLKAILVRSAAAWPNGLTSGVDNSNPGGGLNGTGTWRVGDNRCFPVAKKRR